MSCFVSVFQRCLFSKKPITWLIAGCRSRYNRDNEKFFAVPTVLKHSFSSQKNELSERRRALWIAAIKQDDLTDSQLKNQKVCSKHFIIGKPAALTNENHPDWVPSQETEHNQVIKHRSQNEYEQQYDDETKLRVDKRRRLMESLILKSEQLSYSSKIMGNSSCSLRVTP